MAPVLPSCPPLRISAPTTHELNPAMAAETFARPLTCLARHKFASVRSARRVFSSTRQHLATSGHSAHSSIPDFLLPAFATKKSSAPAFSYRSPPLRQSTAANVRYVSQRRNFSASSTVRAVVVAANPRIDEDGNEMLIDITARAASVCPITCVPSTSSLISNPASPRDHVQRLESQPCTTGHCRIRWLPWFPVPYVSYKYISRILRR